MFQLFAQDQIPATVNRSASGAHLQVNAADLAQTIGPVWFFAILCFVACVFLMAAFLWMTYKFGGNLMVELREFLSGVSSLNSTNSEALKTQATTGLATKKNVESLCDAGHIAANIAQKLAKELDVDIDNDCDKIREKLRTVITS